jgi:hypothetical protein
MFKVVLHKGDGILTSAIINDSRFTRRYSTKKPVPSAHCFALLKDAVSFRYWCCTGYCQIWRVSIKYSQKLEKVGGVSKFGKVNLVIMGPALPRSYECFNVTLTERVSEDECNQAR